MYFLKPNLEKRILRTDLHWWRDSQGVRHDGLSVTWWACGLHPERHGPGPPGCGGAHKQRRMPPSPWAHRPWAGPQAGCGELGQCYCHRNPGHCCPPGETSTPQTRSLVPQHREQLTADKNLSIPTKKFTPHALWRRCSKWNEQGTEQCIKWWCVLFCVYRKRRYLSNISNLHTHKKMLMVVISE